MTHTYSCFGLRLNSPILLPELSEGSARLPGPDAVEITFAPIASDQPAPAEGMLVRRLPDGGAFLEQRNVGRFLVREGRQIVIDPAPGVSRRDLRLYLLGTVLGMLLHQRGVLPLHANAIVVDGQAVAFAGASGAGKSTLAAHFQRADFEVLCDDVCAVTFDGAMQPFAWPGSRNIKLWRDALDMFGQDSAQLSPVMDSMDKFQLPVVAEAEAPPKPLKLLYVIERGGLGAESGVERLSGKAAVHAVMTNIYRVETLAALGILERAFADASALVRNVGVYRATRAWGLDVFEAEVGKLERHIRAEAANLADGPVL